MLRRIQSGLVRLHRDRRGMGTVEVMMIVAVALMVSLGVMQVTGVSTEGAGDSGLFGWLADFASSKIGVKFGK